MRDLRDGGDIRSERVFTIADVAALPDELPSGPVLYELDTGDSSRGPPTTRFMGAL